MQTPKIKMHKEVSLTAGFMAKDKQGTCQGAYCFAKTNDCERAIDFHLSGNAPYSPCQNEMYRTHASFLTSSDLHWNLQFRSRDSSVGIVTCYGLVGRGVGVRVRGPPRFPDQSSPHHPIPPLQVQRIHPGPRLLNDFRKKFIFLYGEGLLAPHPTLKLEDHPLSSVHGCLFNVFAANLHSWRPSLYPRPEDSPGTHLTWPQSFTGQNIGPVTPISLPAAFLETGLTVILPFPSRSTCRSSSGRVTILLHAQPIPTRPTFPPRFGFKLVNAPWYISNIILHNHLRIPYVTEVIRTYAKNHKKSDCTKQQPTNKRSVC
jgi:hypothetical protein